MERGELLDELVRVAAPAIVEGPLTVVSLPRRPVAGRRVAHEQERHQPSAFVPRRSTAASASG